MPLIKLKATAITNLTDARYFAAWEVDWLGFNLSKGSETYISPLQVMAIKEWVEGPAIVGEYAFAPAEEILPEARELGLDAVQIGMFIDLATAMQVAEEFPLIKEVIVEKSSTPTEVEALLSDFAAVSQSFLLDFNKADFSLQDLRQNSALNLHWLRDCCSRYPVLLNINLSPEELLDFLTYIQPLGLNLRGGDEERVGVKSFDELDAIFECLHPFSNL
jgi:phosphoribosylanthranilate isomerase